MENDILFDDIEADDEETGTDECPACGVIPTLDGPTEGCYDPNGCGSDLHDFDEEEMELDEDDEVDELDFG